jgi:elongation factor 1 alpha-like protein
VYLARGLGVQQMLVVVNKMDSVHWSQEAYQRVTQILEPFLEKVGFTTATTTTTKGRPNLRFIPVSGLTGTNVYDKAAAAKQNSKDQQYDTSWYQGPTLMQALDEFESPLTNVNTLQQLEKPLRIILTDVVGEQGKGVAVRGKVVQGFVKTGESLVVLPLGDATIIQKLSSLQPSSESERNKYAVAGEVVDCILANIDCMRVATGNVVTRPHERPSLACKCLAMVWILDGLAIPIIRGAQAIFHMHHLDIPCHMSMLVKTLKKDGSVAKERPRALTANTQAIVELTLVVPIVMEAFSDCKAMGRFVLRRGGESIAVGRIEQVLH